MNQYQFSIGEIPCELSFWVTAASPEAAVKKANLELAEFKEGNKVCIGLRVFSA